MNENVAHMFEDGDIVDVVMRLPSGEVVEERVDYEGVVSSDGKTYLQHHLYRPDGCTDIIPFEEVVELRLVTPRRERRPEDLELG